MIDVIAQTPIEYSKQSRDYQVIARLYTALFNINKMYIDDMSVWDANIDNKLSHLRAKTLNFHPKHAWDYEALDAATSCLKYLVKHKGTIPAIQEAVRILERINRIKDTINGPSVEVDYNTYTIKIMIPKQLASMGVVEDLLELIIPIGMGYRIIETLTLNDSVEDRFVFNDKIDVRKNVRVLPTYKFGVGGPKIKYENGKPVYVDDETHTSDDLPSLHMAPGVIGEIDVQESIWPDDKGENNKSQGAMVDYNLVTTMGEVRDSHGESWKIGEDKFTDNTVDDNTEENIEWKKKKKK